MILPPGVRRAIDGSLWIPRANSAIEDVLDLQFPRVAGELRWWPVERSRRLDAADLVGRWEGKRAIVLGKGPSLERLPEVAIQADDVIAAVNEVAIARTAAPRIDVALAVDEHVVDRILKAGKRLPLFLVPASFHERPSSAGLTLIGDGVFVDGLRPQHGAAAALIRVLALAGVEQLLLVGFDALDGAPDARTAAGTRGRVYARPILELGIPDRTEVDYQGVNIALTRELDEHFRGEIVELHQLPKPRAPKGGG